MQVITEGEEMFMERLQLSIVRWVRVNGNIWEKRETDLSDKLCSEEFIRLEFMPNDTVVSSVFDTSTLSKPGLRWLWASPYFKMSDVLLYISVQGLTVPYCGLKIKQAVIAHGSNACFIIPTI